MSSTELRTRIETTVKANKNALTIEKEENYDYLIDFQDGKRRSA